MALDDFEGEIVLTGTWLYGGMSPTPIVIVARNFDMAFEMNDPDEYPDLKQTPLGPDGRLYYVSFPSGPSMGTQPHHSLEIAKAWADNQVWGPVAWEA